MHKAARAKLLYDKYSLARGFLISAAVVFAAWLCVCQPLLVWIGPKLIIGDAVRLNQFVVSLALSIGLGVPLYRLIHETGHGVLAANWCQSPVKITFGFTHFNDEELSAGQLVAVALAGSGAQIISSVVVFAAGSAFVGSVGMVLFPFAMLLALGGLNLLPMSASIARRLQPDTPKDAPGSDGSIVLKTLGDSGLDAATRMAAAAAWGLILSVAVMVGWQSWLRWKALI